MLNSRNWQFHSFEVYNGQNIFDFSNSLLLYCQVLGKTRSFKLISELNVLCLMLHCPYINNISFLYLEFLKVCEGCKEIHSQS